MTERSAVERPTAAFVLSLLAGIFVLIGGVALGILGAVATFFLAGVGGVLGVAGVIFGIIIIVSAIMLYSRPEGHTAWGVIIIVFSLLSWIGAFGGFVIGFILGLVGGILALVFNPKPMGLISPLRICLKCGTQITDPSLNFCPNCGNDLRISQK